MSDHVEEILPEEPEQEEQEEQQESSALMTVVMSGAVAALLSIVLCYAFFRTAGQFIIKDAVRTQMEKIEKEEKAKKELAQKKAMLQYYKDAALRDDDEF